MSYPTHNYLQYILEFEFLKKGVCLVEFFSKIGAAKKKFDIKIILSSVLVLELKVIFIIMHIEKNENAVKMTNRK